MPIIQNDRWHYRIRWWIVKKLGGTNPYETVKVTRIPVDGKTFADRLFTQKRYIYEQFGREPVSLLMGSEDYEELMDSPEVYKMLSMTSSFNYGQHDVYDMRVTIVPWMRGILVMP